MTRSKEGKVIGGVLSGISKSFNFPTWANYLTKVVVVILGFKFPVIVLGYVLAWLIMPGETGKTGATELMDGLKEAGV